MTRDKLDVIRNEMEQYEAYLLSLIKQLEEKESTAIPGSLHVNSSRSRPRFYHRLEGGLVLPRSKERFEGSSDTSRQKQKGSSDGSDHEIRSERYLSLSSDESLIKRLCQQDYDRHLRSEAEHQLSRIQAALKKIPERGLEGIYTNLLPARKGLIIPAVPDRERYIQDWLNVTWTRKGFEKGAPTFDTVKGDIVRSKSEAIIADRYLQLDVLYRYEYPLRLRDGRNIVVVHPDFTVLNRRTLAQFYHEHFGRMDDPKYVEKFLWKMRVYMANGIFPGENLLLTFETAASPFSVSQLNRLIDKYL